MLIQSQKSPANWFRLAATDDHATPLGVSHAGPRTKANPRLLGKPEALPGVGSSDLRHSNVHRLKKLRSDSHQKRAVGRPHRGARNVTEKPAKHTKRNPRRRRETAQPPNSTGGNGGNRGSIRSPFAPLPPVQNSQGRLLMPNVAAQWRARKDVRIGTRTQSARSLEQGLGHPFMASRIARVPKKAGRYLCEPDI